MVMTMMCGARSCRARRWIVASHVSLLLSAVLAMMPAAAHAQTVISGLIESDQFGRLVGSVDGACVVGWATLEPAYQPQDWSCIGCQDPHAIVDIRVFDVCPPIDSSLFTVPIYALPEASINFVNGGVIYSPADYYRRTRIDYPGLNPVYPQLLAVTLQVYHMNADGTWDLCLSPDTWSIANNSTWLHYSTLMRGTCAVGDFLMVRAYAYALDASNVWQGGEVWTTHPLFWYWPIIVDP